jgi:hypothetical protein
MNDPLDELLALPPAPDDGAKLRQEILLRSTGVLRRRRRWKRLAWAASLAACYAAGMLTMRWFTPPAAGVEVAAAPTQETKNETPPVVQSARAVENLALDSTEHRAELYRQAAGLYRKDGDLASWVRCKDNALAEAKKEDLTVSADDDFLEIALKQARQKEKRDARTLE